MSGEGWALHIFIGTMLSWFSWLVLVPQSGVLYVQYKSTSRVLEHVVKSRPMKFQDKEILVSFAQLARQDFNLIEHPLGGKCEEILYVYRKPWSLTTWRVTVKQHQVTYNWSDKPCK